MDRESAPAVPPPPALPAHPSPPSANSWTLPKTPSQLIRHCLLPLKPMHKRPPRSQQGFPLKPLHWWPPGMPVALGTGRTRLDWMGKGCVGSRTIEPGPSCSYAGARQSKIGGQQKEMHSTPKDRKHLPLLVTHKPRLLYNTNSYKTPGICHTWENTDLAHSQLQHNFIQK